MVGGGCGVVKVTAELLGDSPAEFTATTVRLYDVFKFSAKGCYFLFR